jgi:cell wall-associated NlpC family hydrolase
MNGKYPAAFAALPALILMIASSCTTVPTLSETRCYPTPPPAISTAAPLAADAADPEAASCGVSPKASPSPVDRAIVRTFDQVIGELDFYVAYSERLGVPLTGAENKALILAIDEWLGARYRYGGCAKTGVDCSCLVKTIYEQVYGIQLNRSSRDMFYEDVIPVEPEELREGDILTFKIRGNRISHVGLYLRDDKFVHASRSEGVTIDDLTNPYFRKRFFAGGRVKWEPTRIGMAGSYGR